MLEQQTWKAITDMCTQLGASCTLQWVPGHAQLIYQELSDQLAKAAADLPQDEVPLSLSTAKAVIRADVDAAAAQVLKAHQSPDAEHWRRATTDFEGIRHAHPPQLRCGRAAETTLMQARCGKAFWTNWFRAYINLQHCGRCNRTFKHKEVRDGKCLRCRADLQKVSEKCTDCANLKGKTTPGLDAVDTVHHHLCICPAWHAERKKHLGSNSVGLHILQDSPGDVLSYLSATGRLRHKNAEDPAKTSFAVDSSNDATDPADAKEQKVPECLTHSKKRAPEAAASTYVNAYTQP
jgi:hypothetical protein